MRNDQEYLEMLRALNRFAGLAMQEEAPGGQEPSVTE